MKNFYLKRNLGTYCTEVLILLVSAFIYSLAFPGFLNENGLGFISFFALIPVFVIIKNTSFIASGIYGFIFGFVFYAIFNYWLTTFHQLAILIVTIIKGTEMLMLFYALKLATIFFKKHAYLVQAVIWVAYAYLSESWFAGYAYGTIAYSLYSYLPLIQIAEFTGIWAIIFMQILPQAFIASFSSGCFRGKDPSFKNFIKKHKVFPVVYLVLFVLWFVTGLIQLNIWTAKEADKSMKIAAIQHNADTWEGGYDTYRKNFSNLRRLSLEAKMEDPDLVAWSETAFVPSVSWHTTYSYDGNELYYGNSETKKLVQEFIDFAADLDIPLITGNPKGVLKDPTLPPMLENGELNREDYNSVLLFEDGEIVEEYTKLHLVPFTEHFPYEKQLPWLYNILLANDYNWWLAGTEPVVFELNDIKFATPICYEDTFGYLSAGYVASGADLILNMTNDRWSGSADAALQHGTMATFRSVENRKTMLRSTNSGYTCLILPNGKIVQDLEQFKMTYEVFDVPIYLTETNGLTFFTTHIDLFAHIAIYLSVFMLTLGLVLHIRRKINEK